MHAFFAGLGRFSVRFRWLIVVVWLAGTFLAVHFLPSLGSVVNNNNTAFLPANAPDVKAADLAAPLGGTENLEPVTIIAYASGKNAQLTATDLAAIDREVSLARTAPNVERVQFVGISADHKAIQLSALADVGGFSPLKAENTVNALLATFPKVSPPPGLHFYLGGQVADAVYQNKQSSATGAKTQDLSILFIIVLLLLIFRSVLAPFVTLLPAIVVLQLSGSIIGELGTHAGLQVSQISQLLLIVIVLGAGTDYGLFLVFRVREGFRDGLDPKEAVSLAVARVGESISASAGTVILALLSLLFATFGIYHDLGIPLAIGIATMLLAGLTLLPALLAILGRAVFWPSRPRPGQAQGGAWGRVAARIVQHPVPTLLIGLVAFGALATGVAFYKPAGFGGATSAPAGTEAAAGDQLIAAHFPHASTNPTNLIFEYPNSVWVDPSVLVRAQASLRSSGQFLSIDGPLSPAGAPLTPGELQQLHARFGSPKNLSPVPPRGVSLASYEEYRAEALFVSASGRVVQFEATLRAGNGNPGSTAALDAVPVIRRVVTTAAAASGATANGVAGEAPALYDISATSDSDLVHIIPLAVIAIAILLALVLRSAVAPFYLIASVVLSYLAALGLACFVFIELGHSGGLTFLLPFLMFIFLLALGEDYNILVMTRIREEAHDHTLKEAVVRAVGLTGPVITSAGLVLAGTFAVLTYAGSSGSGGSQIRDIGTGLAAGILMDTFLVRTLLVPSTVALLGRWNWWPRRVEAGMGYPGTGRSQELEAVAVPVAAGESPEAGRS
ncbi:MAG TPA: MMPL family transporter [Acidimicrobiales bacterium]|nr:MMPL family transporter [Acidimicrobiales bacterium]